MEYFVRINGQVVEANADELADVSMQLYTKDTEGNLVEVDRNLLPAAIDATTPASTAPATDTPVQSDAVPVTVTDTQPTAQAPAEEISEPTEDERFSALVETTVDILHSKGWAFGNELQALVNKFK